MACYQGRPAASSPPCVLAEQRAKRSPLDHIVSFCPQAKQSLATLTKDVPKRHSLAMPGETVLNGNQEWVVQADLPLTAAIRQSQQTLYHSHPPHPADRQGEACRCCGSGDSREPPTSPARAAALSAPWLPAGRGRWDAESEGWTQAGLVSRPSRCPGASPRPRLCLPPYGLVSAPSLSTKQQNRLPQAQA